MNNSIIFGLCMLSTPLLGMVASLPKETATISLAFETQQKLVLNFSYDSVKETYQFIFKPIETVTEEDGDFYRYVQAITNTNATTIVDVLPVNGIFQKRLSRFFEHLFNEESLKELEKEVQLSGSLCKHNNLKVFVLDLKDSQGKYVNIDTIRQAEDAIRDLLHTGSHPAAVLIRKLGVQFFLREGLLKALVLRSLSSVLQDYCYTSEGRAFLCILCEIIMNGFKRGYAVALIKHSSTSESYFDPSHFLVSTMPPNQKARLPSSVKPIWLVTLQTYYPAYYKDMYGVNSLYYQVLIRLNHLHHQFDNATGCTVITLA